jgi:thymidylate synthase ThyX
MTINARNLELVMRRFASHNLQEINELGKKFYQLVIKIAPSIILFCKTNDYDQKTYPVLHAYASTLMKQTDEPAITSSRDVELIDYTTDADDKILAALLFKTSQKKYSQCLHLIKRMPKHKKEELFKKSCQYMELYDAALREFEFANLTYSFVVSAACFGQLKRHRITTITSQDYNPLYGITIPEAVRKIGEEKRFIEIIKRTENVYKKIEKKQPGIGAYVLTNAHHKRVLFKTNLRELYHLSRLREDVTAQWDIRNKVHKMSNLANKVMPISSKLLGGKDEYPKIYFKLFGKKPKIDQTPQPG